MDWVAQSGIKSADWVKFSKAYEEFGIPMERDTVLEDLKNTSLIEIVKIAVSEIRDLNHDLADSKNKDYSKRVLIKRKETMLNNIRTIYPELYTSLKDHIPKEKTVSEDTEECKRYLSKDKLNEISAKISPPPNLKRVLAVKEMSFPLSGEIASIIDSSNSVEEAKEKITEICNKLANTKKLTSTQKLLLERFGDGKDYNIVPYFLFNLNTDIYQRLKRKTIAKRSANMVEILTKDPISKEEFLITVLEDKVWEKLYGSSI